MKEKRDNRLCEQTKILPAPNGEKKKAFFLETLALINSYTPHHIICNWWSRLTKRDTYIISVTIGSLHTVKV